MTIMMDTLWPLSLKNSLVVFVYFRALILPSELEAKSCLAQEKIYLVISSQVMNTFITNMLARIESWLNILYYPLNDLYRNSELDNKITFLDVPCKLLLFECWTFVSKV